MVEKSVFSSNHSSLTVNLLCLTSATNWTNSNEEYATVIKETCFIYFV